MGTTLSPKHPWTRLEAPAVEGGPLRESLLISLLGRARETQRGGVLDDPKAVQIVDALGCTAFDARAWAPSLLSASLRTRMVDEDVASFLMVHPEGTVVELGCGLGSRFDRLDNGRCRWVDVDVADVIALRRRFFTDTDRRRMFSARVVETDWLHRLPAGPVCFVSESSLLPCTSAEVRAVLETISQQHAGAWVVVDTVSRSVLEGEGTDDALRHLTRGSRWICDDPKALESWGAGFVLDRSRTLADASPTLRRSLPLSMQLTLALAPGWLRYRTRGHRMNRFIATRPLP